MEASLTSIPRLVGACTIFTSFSLACPVYFSLPNDPASTQGVQHDWGYGTTYITAALGGHVDISRVSLIGSGGLP